MNNELPYKISLSGEVTVMKNAVWISSSDGKNIAAVDAFETSEGKDRAAFIIRACNNFDDLIACIESVIASKGILVDSEVNDLRVIVNFAKGKAIGKIQPEDNECPYCGGEGIIDSCDCDDDCCVCADPEPSICIHCQ